MSDERNDEFPRVFVPSEAEADQAEVNEEVNKPFENAQSLSVEQTLQTLKLIKARAEAETAEYHKRLVMQQFRPCKLYPVIIYHDGIRWVCSYGVFGDKYRDYLPDSALGQSGVEAYGKCPEEALQNFDALWVGNVGPDAEEDEDDEPDDCLS